MLIMVCYIAKVLKKKIVKQYLNMYNNFIFKCLQNKKDSINAI